MLERKLLNSIRELTNDNDLTDTKYCCEYTSVISDGIISLSIWEKIENDEINNKLIETFDIVLNDTGENIGSISFDYYSRNLQFGNVSYAILNEFQNKGYATRALRLLVNLLKNNNYEGNKDLYFWISYYNEYSQKVVLNNGGEIISGGESETKSPYMLRIKI